MGKRPTTRRENLVIPGVSPEDGAKTLFTLSQTRLRPLGRGRGPGPLLEARDLVRLAVATPEAIFEGLSVDADEPRGRGVGWLCYCIRPPYAYRANGTKRDPYPGHVFLVFANHEKVIYNWYWCKADHDDDKLPADHADRFGKRVL